MSKRDSETKKAWSALFGRAAVTYGQVGPDAFLRWGRRVVELAQIRSGATVVDVATGRGAALFPAVIAVGAAGRVIGADIAEQMIENTAADVRDRRVSNAGLCRMDAEQLGLASRCADSVL